MICNKIFFLIKGSAIYLVLLITHFRLKITYYIDKGKYFLQ
jgi:hypothetical protein